MDQRCYKCKYGAIDLQRMPAQAPNVSLEPPKPEPTLDEKIATHLAPEPGGSVEQYRSVDTATRPITFGEWHSNARTQLLKALNNRLGDRMRIAEEAALAKQDRINSLELRIEQLNDDYDSQEAFIDMQAEQLRKAKNMIERSALLPKAPYLSEDFEL
jgi:hypothetical protein